MYSSPILALKLWYPHTAQEFISFLALLPALDISIFVGGLTNDLHHH
jgi:hypothetical protein